MLSFEPFCVLYSTPLSIEIESHVISITIIMIMMMMTTILITKTTRILRCIKFNQIRKKADKEWTSYFFHRFKHICQNCFDNRNFKKSVRALYLRSTFRCVQNKILIDRWVVIIVIEFTMYCTCVTELFNIFFDFLHYSLSRCTCFIFVSVGSPLMIVNQCNT